MFELFLKGLLIGFAIAAPVGPIGILCIQRSLHDGFKVGLMTGLGAALADCVYGLVAAFSLTAVSSVLVAHQFWIRVIGGIFLTYHGIKLLFTTPSKQSRAGKPDRSSIHAFITTFFLTLTNPTTILSYIAVFAGLGLGSGIHTDYWHAWALVLGITVGSACWWLCLSSIVAYILHHRMSSRTMRIINCISGSVILIFGIFALQILIEAV